LTVFCISYAQAGGFKDIKRINKTRNKVAEKNFISLQLKTKDATVSGK